MNETTIYLNSAQHFDVVCGANTLEIGDTSLYTL